jgi:hypothetical protein
MSEQVQEAQQFQKILHDPDAWGYKAMFLRIAARVLWDTSDTACKEVHEWMSQEEDLTGAIAPPAAYKIPVRSQAIFLYALAVENLIKACIVSGNRGQPTMNNRGQIVWSGAGDGHDLVRLAQAANLTCDLDSGLLELLAQWIRWMGRYPLPKKCTPQFATRHFPKRQNVESCYKALASVYKCLRSGQASGRTPG